MIVKIISRDQSKSESFLEYNGQVGVEQKIPSVMVNDQYGVFLDKVIILRHFYGFNSHCYIGIDSSRFMVFLLNNQGQNIQKLV